MPVIDKSSVIAQVVAAFPDVSEAQLSRLLSPEMPDEERAIILKSWNDAKVVPGPDGWTVFLNILKASAEIANLVIPIEGALQGIANIGRG